MSGFLDSIVSIEPPFNMVVLMVLIFSAAAVIKTVAAEIRKSCTHRDELQLKRELLDRGMGASDVERVIRASSPANRDK